jgi:hypothetical protein
MVKKCLSKQTAGMGFVLLLLSGCDALRAAQDDLSRLTSRSPSTQVKQAAASTPTATAARSQHAAARPTAGSAKTDPQPAVETPASDPALAVASPIGKNEGEVRALFGPPSKEEERAPGKTWHYRDGQCTMDIQFYPDVQTRQFGTLAYEVKSDDNTDEGKRGCLAQFKSRAQARRGG